MSDKLSIHIDGTNTEFQELKEQLKTLDLDSMAQIILVQQRDLSTALNALKDEETYDWTGLVSKKGFEVVMDIEMHESRRNNTPLSVINMDLKKFKDINEKEGYPAGDEVLKRFANFLKENTRESDIAVHLSGDEYLVVLPNTDKNGAEILAKNFEMKLDNLKETSSTDDRIKKIEMRYTAGEWVKSMNVKEYLDNVDTKRFEDKRE